MYSVFFLVTVLRTYTYTYSDGRFSTVIMYYLLPTTYCLLNFASEAEADVHESIGVDDGGCMLVDFYVCTNPDDSNNGGGSGNLLRTIRKREPGSIPGDKRG
jgi:hypothetical protein